VVDHPPCPERLRQPEDGSAHLLRQGSGGARGIAGHHDVDVAYPPAQQLVAQRAADDPGVGHGRCRRRTRGVSAQVTS
jgi:hypothetical protein